MALDPMQGSPALLEQPGQVAAYLTHLLRDHEDEPEAIKAGVRYCILTLKRMQIAAKLRK